CSGQSDAALRTSGGERLRGVAPRLLPGPAPGAAPPGLANPVAPQQLDKVIAVLGEDRDGDSINVGVRVEVRQSVDDDRLAVDLEELLWYGARVHAGADAAGEDDGHVHGFRPRFAADGLAATAAVAGSRHARSVVGCPPPGGSFRMSQSITRSAEPVSR